MKRSRIHRTRWAGVKLEARVGTSRRAADHAQRVTKTLITTSGRVWTGRMRNSVYVRPTISRPERTSWAIGSSLQYFTYQNEGVGPIFARRGMLRIRLRTGVIYRPRTYVPVRGGKFLQGAITNLRLQNFAP